MVGVVGENGGLKCMNSRFGSVVIPKHGSI